MSAASSFFCFLRDVRRPLTHIRGIAGYFALVDPLSLAVAPSSRAMFDTYDRSLCGGVPAVWPRAPRWPTDAALLAKIGASLAPEFGMVTSLYLLEAVMNQRLMGRAVYYCGKECQKKDWKTHKKVCAQMAVGKVASSFEKL